MAHVHVSVAHNKCSVVNGRAQWHATDEAGASAEHQMLSCVVKTEGAHVARANVNAVE
jgi:hypothetical protein